ncbi:MAG: bifunctional UDP-sugar hydrolase/5'-nucleotidase [Eubacteriales bacterium]|nr:bifunctional UDP-sugar hydrolase/5'-nucleotidase [Eubacteriales bacterium]
MRKILSCLLALALLLSGLTAFAEETAAKDVVVLYTNDVHCGIDENIGYAGLAAYKKAFAKAGYDVLLVDNGDAIQGGPVGTLSKGEYIIDIMNEVGYDVATIGNHEFDYGMDQFMALREKAKFPYVSANFTDLEGKPILDPFVIKEAGGRKIAFVGASTPETFTKSTPTYFQNEKGEYIYDFCEGEDGKRLYAAVQKAVDDAREAGAEYVVVLAHLGIDGSSVPYTSSDLIVNTNGIDAVLDGHSHSTIEQEVVKNKDGEEVLLSSTGTKLAAVGALTIAADGTLSTRLHTESIFQDDETTAFVEGIKAQYGETLAKVVASSQVDLIVNDLTAVDSEGKPIRIIRSQETNLGDLCADAYRLVSGADIGVVNGGGIRAAIPAGDITFEQIISVHPFGNAMCVVEATGQQILDALEKSVSKLPDENGGFLHVSGLTFTVDMSVPSTVVVDDKGNFVEVSGERRVKDVKVGGEDLDPAKTYTLASHNYMLKSGGDGFNMFINDKLLQDEVMLDNQVLITYITENLGGVIGEEYAEPYGQGRITIINAD